MNRRSFLSSVSAAGAAGAFAGFAPSARAQSTHFVTPASPPVPGIIEVGGTKQMFLDNELVHEASRISTVVTRPDKYAGNPILVADRDWEMGRSIQMDGLYELSGVQITGQAVLFDEEEKIFKMWYLGMSWEKRPGEAFRRRPLCYATSKDGLHWEKPELGLYEYKGSKRNNILGDWGDPQYFNFIKDPHDPDPARRYKAMGEMEGSGQANRNGGVAVAFSPDGLRWTQYAGNPVVHHGRNLGDAPTMLGWDPLAGRYVGFFRPGIPLAPEIYGTGDRRHIRSYGYSSSSDFVHWEPTRLMMTPDYADRNDTQYMQLTAGVDGQFHIGFNAILQTFEQTWDVFLMSSRDGFHWNWLDRKVPFLGRGEIGSYDDGYMTPSGPIIHDGKVWIFYGAYSGAHSFLTMKGKLGPTVMTVALCTLPQDRWMGLLAGPYRGTLVTHPLIFKGSKLVIDIEAGLPDMPRRPARPHYDEPEFRVALEGPSGGTIEGFTIDRSNVLTYSGRQEITWGGSGDVSRLAGQPVRIRCEYRNAALYGFQFV